ncbi:16S rRNA (guanine(966)-N(2))-methyltransferase RsmD [Sanguibacter sp. 4.1]|uniref:16S rRNA (Guanine(966)-N(2))-methyltransferase RsmD n=1 Tax=Sanguibacter biliveldensis TaxID=3030830 RepID=A0AAF1C3Q2_9MICO|nr:16S rRNA (guanine(966)-N(2))-methyltransferase RsmD [Sanguibacter sp. 4.1]WPF83435.1 16S rRNA (guanine(966)-N(2))-methyltransferase RsmD [Sanguibacter sp. 4.1]
MTRIVAGLVGGRSLAVPPKGTRPTSDKVREAIFSRLEHYEVLDGARVLDLCAGSGALGLEAASRGASTVVLVEAGRVAAQVCQKNVDSLGLRGVRVVTDRAERFVAQLPTQPWDLVFLDPPYDMSDDDVAALLLALEGHVSDDAVIVVERSSRTPEPTWPASWRLIVTKPYGETLVHYAEPGADDDTDLSSAGSPDDESSADQHPTD